MLFLSSIKGLSGDPHPSDQFNQWNPCFRLLQYRDDLFNVESLLFHGKSPLPEVLDFAGNQPSKWIKNTGTAQATSEAAFTGC